MRPAPGSDTSPERVEEVLAEVLERPEFGEQEPGFLAEALEDFFEWLGDLFSSTGGGRAADEGFNALLIVLGVIFLVVLLLLLIEVARSRSRRARAEVPQDVAPAAVVRRVEELRREARRAEDEGDWIRALRLYFFAAVIGLGERGDLDYRDAWTNRELFERGRPSPRTRELLAPLVAELDGHSFGLRPADADGVRVFAEACDRVLKGSEE